ncbi:hypothetical protein H0H92_002605 [Tricholoma furcatifolium]|nr:hypothetical protein H0H92_002605 [Tricholoma furcatifolium]
MTSENDAFKTPEIHHKTDAMEVAKSFASFIKNKRVIITGVTLGGLGAECARVLVAHGAEVILAGRTSNKIQDTVDVIKKEFPEAKMKQLILDLSSQAAIRKAADEVLKYDFPIDVVFLNAGIMGAPYSKTPDGLESQFGINHIGHFLFGNLILPKLIESPAPRIVSVSSVGHFWSPVRFDDYSFDDGKTYDKWAAYTSDLGTSSGQSKTANILFAVELTERYKSHNLTAFSLHACPSSTIISFTAYTYCCTLSQPGGSITSLMQYMTKEDYEKFSDFYSIDGSPKGDWALTVPQCTATHIVAGFDPAISGKSGSYLTNLQLANDQVAPYAFDKAFRMTFNHAPHAQENAKRLWTLSEELVGQKF